MKTKLFTKNVYLGLLMAFVLALGVPGIADALTFRENRTGDLQTIIMTNEFTVSLTVTLGSNTTVIRNSNNQLVSDDNNTRIDSSGYTVFEASNGTEYRLSTAATALSSTFILTNGAKPHLSGDPNQAASTSGDLYVSGGSTTSNGSVVDSTGTAVYIRSGNGDATTPYTYARAMARPNEKISDEDRYHYNEEAIEINVPTGTTLTKVGNYRVNVAGGTAHTMNELASSVDEDKLTSSLRLTFRADTVGEKIITITDETDGTDRPGDASQPLSFTIFVVPALDTTTDLSLASTPDTLGSGGYTIGNDNGDLQINTLFTGGTNAPRVYRVEGSGRLYIREVYAGDALGSPTSRSSGTQMLSTSSEANVFLDMNGSSNKVTAYTRDRNAAETGRTVAFIFNYATIEITSGNNQTGVPEARLIDPLSIRVKDSRGRAVPGLAVTFTPTSGEGSILEPILGSDVYLTSGPTTTTWAATFSTTLRVFQATKTVPSNIQANEARLVPTNRSGEAQVYLKVGAANTSPKTVTVNAGGATKTFFATSAVSTDIPALEIFSGNNQSSESDGRVKNPLMIRVLNSNNQPRPNERVTFTTTKGYLTTLVPYRDADSTPVTRNGPATQVTADTDQNGKAAVSYDLVEHSGASEVIAVIRSESASTSPYERRVTFNINGGGARASNPTPPPASTQTGRLEITVTGEGETRSVTVNAFTAAGVANPVPILVTLTGTAITSTQVVTTGTATEITVPTTPDDYTLTATAGVTGYTPDTETITVAGPTSLGTISITQIGSPNNGVQTFSITVVDTDGNRISGALTVTVSGSGFTTSSVPTVNGSGAVNITLPTRAGSYTLTARAEGYTSGTAPVRIAGATPTTPTTITTPTTTTTPTVSEPDRVSIVGPSQRSGTANTELDAALIVQVVDDDGDAVADVRVIFRVRTGQGRLSQRGNGRAIAVQTDSNGHARADYTPMSASSTVEVEVRGVSEKVTFMISTGSAPATATGTSDTAGSQTYKAGTKIPSSEVSLTFSDSRTLNGSTYTCVGPDECVISNGFVTKGEVRVAAVQAVQAKTYKAGTKIPSSEVSLSFTGSRMLNGSTYTCVGPDECVISNGFVTKGEIRVAVATAAPKPVSSGTDVSKVVLRGSASSRPVMYVVAGGALYRLAGSEATEIAERATDVAVGSNKLYWIEEKTARTGAVHTSNLDGSNPEVLKELTSAPKGLALANQKLYITNGWGKIQRMNIDGTQFETNFRVDLGSPQHIAVAGGNVYWTDGSGRVRFTSISGPKTIRNIVTGSGALGGLAVDARRVYWTETTGERSGRIRASNLAGTGAITDVYTVTATVHGLAIDPAKSQLYWTNGWGKVQRGAPSRGDVVTGLMTPIALAIGGANTATKPTTPTLAAKPNYDVDGSGTVDNADLFLVSLAVGTDNAQYDVNGDGTVNDKDIALVRDNRDNGAAAAPMVFGVKLTAEQVGRLQEQIDLLIVSGDRSPDALKTLVYLQQLIATARPEQTQLLANYPNPFNPETWIPYELATDTDVRITIYAANGVVVRTLQLGQQSAGYYTDRERAAYWDGRNASGETVASGVYFYQLETDEMSTLRKMVILK